MKVRTRVNSNPQPLSPGKPFDPTGLHPEDLANYEALIASRPREAGVYFIKAGNAIKIGYSISVTDRMVNLQTGNHEKLQLLGLLNIEQRYERLIRAQFEHLHLHNEWFRDDPEIRLYLLEHEALA
jgi:hypothetical protein